MSAPISPYNLSAWALKHQALMLYALCALLLAGCVAYAQLGQTEDPDFTFKVMTIKLRWAGASAQEIEQQVVDRIERKLQETPWLDNVSSYSTAGEAVIFVTLKDAMPPAALDKSWYSVRKTLADLRDTLPEGVGLPIINDDFGNTASAIYAFSSDTLDNAELSAQVSIAREALLTVANVSKVRSLGAQAEKIYIEFSSQKMAALHLDPLQVAAALKAQNAMEPAGELVSHEGITRLRVSGDFKSLQSIQDIGIQAAGKTHRLGDICNVYRGYADPAAFKVHTQGKAAIALAVSMSEQGDVSRLGKDLAREMLHIKALLPNSVTITQIADQAHVVKTAISDFMRALLEALVIVLAVSFVSLGLRAGLVVGLSIPIVLAGTFLVMNALGIDLHRVSLGALIIALGLLVDDAMIAVEMMQVKLAQGYSKFHAASYAYSSTAFPMLTGTLITAAAFLPVGLAKSSAGEYTIAICAVVSIALLVSWLVAVIFTPLMGYRLLRKPTLGSRCDNHYQQGFYQHFRRVVRWCLWRKKTVVALTLATFLLAVAGYAEVEQEFFPPSERPELLMDVWLPEGATFAATEALTSALEKQILNIKDIANVTSYIGGSTPRFYLPLDLTLPAVNYAQIVITPNNLKAREAVLREVRQILARDYSELGIRIARLENGPPVGYPVQFRVLGKDTEQLYRIAAEVEKLVKANPHSKNVSVDSNQAIRVVHVDVDQEKARALGLSSQSLSRNLQALLSGVSVSSLREGEKRIEIVARTNAADRHNPAALTKLNIRTPNGAFVALGDIATVSAASEDGIIWRMNRLPVVTVRADVPDDISAPDVSSAINQKIDLLRSTLPVGYRIEVGGALEGDDQATDSIIAVLPLTALIIVSLLMLQLQRFNLVVLALLTAPLGIIGVTAALLLFHVPFGFVAMLGMISLAGMIMRNSVILLDQIGQDIKAGATQYDAIIEATVRRFRPIMLTAAAAILAMIPLTRSVFWGPLAVVIMGGLLVATFLTLLYLPALYAMWYKVDTPRAKTGI
ncbi:MAG: efflux RND transporter permease subunit [Gallionella sp.]